VADAGTRRDMRVGVGRARVELGTGRADKN